MRRTMIAAAAMGTGAIVAIAAYVVTEINGNGSFALAIIGLLLALGALYLTGLFAYRLHRQAARVSDAARAIAAGEVSSRVPPDEETSELSETFNLMAANIAQIVEGARAERSRLIAALDSSIDAVVALDAEGQVAFANRAAGGIFNRSREDLAGSHFAYLMPSDEVVEALRSSREQDQPQTRVVQRAGNEWLQVSIAPIVGGGGWSALVVIHNVSDVRRMEQVRREFIANVSHELRTPLAGIKSVLDTLEGGAISDEPTAREFLERADREVDRLVRMVEELLELSRIESGEVPIARERVDINEVISDTMRRLSHTAEQNGVSLKLENGAEPATVTGDADRLERVVVNLVGNAIKFTPEGGSVTVAKTVADGMVSVRVCDTGVGIDPDDLPRVFERFYKADRSRRGGGTGLGLAVVKHTIEAHGGTVGVESAPGRGSTFWFQVPLANNPDS